MKQQLPPSERRPYESPKIFRVRIAGEELAVAGCKGTATGGPTGSSCFKTNCFATAS